MKKLFIYATLFIFAGLYSCSENDLNPSLKQDKIFEAEIQNFDELMGIANGMYDKMEQSAYYGRDYIIYNEVRSDNCFANGKSGKFLTVAAMNVSPDDNYATSTWTNIYQVIANANILIQQNPERIDGNAEKVKHIIGEAYIMRAWAHFDLLKLYGQQHTGGKLGIPYVTEYIPKYTGEQIAPSRQSVAENKQSILADIEAGLSLMLESQDDHSKQLITTHAANALKARIALYFKDWQMAKDAALNVVNSSQFQIADSAEFVQSWSKDAAVNSIFELAFSTTDNLDFSSLSYIYRGSGYGDIEVLDTLLSIFDDGDIRRNLIGYEIVDDQPKLRNLGKYPSQYSDNVSLLRYEEVILTLAEAKLELNENDALEYLNRIPAQRNAKLYEEATKENILKERRREFCFEGFRFDDLARTGQDIPLVDPLNQIHGGPEYGSYKFAFPVPTSEMIANPNMEQNQGY